MSKITLELSPIAIERASKEAIAEQVSIEKYLEHQLDPPCSDKKNGWATFGLFADDPELIDEVIELIYKERAKSSAVPSHMNA